MTSKEFRPAHAYVIAGIVATGAIALLTSSRVAGVVAGVVLVVLAWIRYTGKNPVAIAARSPRFDSLVLVLLGVGTVFLALTTDNL